MTTVKWYERYKNSGVPWVGKIPDHWEEVKLGWIGNFTSSGIDKKIIEGQPLVRMINYTDVYIWK